MPLPLMTIQGRAGARVSCWKFSWRERFRILMGANVHLMLLTFNQPIQPQLMSTKLEDITDAIRETEN
ncbi:hypothetical protein EOM86_11045 [Candidatus Nomurabacteria bacterium]|nr:hypothetical protein [Candidatus Nomurabacteria bacterium]